MARVALTVAGLAALGWGAALLVPLLTGPDAVSVLGWLVGGPVLHDLLLAPVAGLLGVLVARLAGPRWRPLLAGGLVVSGVLALVAVPLLWRAYAGPPNPGLDDRDYRTGLLAAVGVVWLMVVAAGLAGGLRRTRRGGSAGNRRAPDG
jgi:hypothetical protein